MSDINYLFCILLCLCQTVKSLSLHREQLQRPFPSGLQTNTAPFFSTSRVLLAVTSVGGDGEYFIELPLRQRIGSGIDLPRQLRSAKIVALLNEHRQSAPLAELDSVICRVKPKFSTEEKGWLSLSRMETRAWPWFDVKDGAVQFDQASSRWFLAGREIDNYECR